MIAVLTEVLAACPSRSAQVNGHGGQASVIRPGFDAGLATLTAAAQAIGAARASGG